MAVNLFFKDQLLKFLDPIADSSILSCGHLTKECPEESKEDLPVFGRAFACRICHQEVKGPKSWLLTSRIDHCFKTAQKITTEQEERVRIPELCHLIRDVNPDDYSKIPAIKVAFDQILTMPLPRSPSPVPAPKPSQPAVFVLKPGYKIPNTVQTLRYEAVNKEDAPLAIFAFYKLNTGKIECEIRYLKQSTITQTLFDFGVIANADKGLYHSQNLQIVLTIWSTLQSTNTLTKEQTEAIEKLFEPELESPPSSPHPKIDDSFFEPPIDESTL